MTRYNIVNDLIAKHGYQTYLEIGVDQGESFDRVTCPVKHGVDPHGDRATHKMTSDEFFNKNTNIYDIVFIDGLHLAEQVQRDIENSLRVLSLNGSIVIHDCLPREEQHQLREHTPGQTWTGDTWKAIAELRFTRQDLFIIVVDCDWGCGVVRSGVQQLRQRPPMLDFSYFLSHRNILMNIVTEQQWIAEFHPYRPYDPEAIRKQVRDLRDRLEIRNAFIKNRMQ
jgi:hypothetical protein